MTSPKPELKPCRRCGSKARFGQKGGVTGVVCTNPKCVEFTVVVNKHYDGITAAEEAAAEDWNERAKRVY